MTVFLVRHASAGHRNDADPDDADRPLDPDGVEQSRRIAKALTGTAITRVVSSPAARCTATVAPLTAKLGLDCEVTDDLYEGTPIERSWAVLERAARAKGDVVLCSHGDVIPELVSRAQGRGMEVRGKSGCAKASVWTLQFDGERFTSGSYSKPAAD